ncbi:MAG: PEP-CTERM sorting domain-containing protein [Pirellulales bacterium]
MKVNSSLPAAAGLGLACVLGLVAVAGAGTTSWKRNPANPGDWSDVANWTDGLPDASSDAYINNGGTAQIGTGGAASNYLYLNRAVGSSATLVHTGGNNTVRSAMFLGSDLNTNGVYQLSGSGALTAGGESIGHYGTGRFIQTGGGNTVQSSLFVGYFSTGSSYELSGGGVLSASSETAGYWGQGKFLQTGGSNTAGTLTLGYNAGAEGTYDLSGNSRLWTRIQELGMGGTGRLTQSGGTNTAADTLKLGRDPTSNGTYELKDTGTLSAVRVFVGDQYGTGTFLQTGGTNTVSDSLRLGSQAGSQGTYTISAGTLQAKDVDLGYYVGSHGTLNITGAAAKITVTNKLRFASGSELSAVAGASIHVTGATLENQSTDPAKLAGLSHLGLVFEGGAAKLANVEVAGEDRGAVLAGLNNNFALGGLHLGGADVGRIKLVDLVDNETALPDKEALYVKSLSLGASAYLDLGGLNLYYLGGSIDPTATVVPGGGSLTRIPALAGDVDLDSDVDIFDVAVLQTNYGAKGVTWSEGDFNGDGNVDIFDVAMLQVNYGAGVPAGAPIAAPVPEPTSIVLAVLAAAALVAVARRRKA